MFRAALWIVAKNWKPKWPSAWEWTNKLWDSHMMENYPTILENKYFCTDIHKTWINLKNMLHKRDRQKRVHTKWISLRFQQHTKLMIVENQNNACFWQVERNWKGSQGNFLRWENHSTSWLATGYIWLCGFPGGSGVTNPSANVRDARGAKSNPWEGKIPWRRHWQPTPVFLPGRSHGQRDLGDYSPWGCKKVRYNLATKQCACTLLVTHFQNSLNRTLKFCVLRYVKFTSRNKNHCRIFSNKLTIQLLNYQGEAKLTNSQDTVEGEREQVRNTLFAPKSRHYNWCVRII